MKKLYLFLEIKCLYTFIQIKEKHVNTFMTCKIDFIIKYFGFQYLYANNRRETGTILKVIDIRINERGRKLCTT